MVSSLLTLSTRRSKHAMHLMLYLSTLLTLVFVALTQHLMQVWKLCIKWPLAPARREDYCIVWAFHRGGLAVHQSVQGGSFVNFLGPVKLQGWLQARHTANPQFLKLKGAQQPGNSYKSMKAASSIPQLNLPQINLEFRALQCLKCGSLWSSLGIGRFRCLHSSLMQAIRCANSEHSASNAGVPTDPHSPESNSSYLAQIWPIRELYSLCASCTVIKKTCLGMIRSDKYQFVSNFNVDTVNTAKTCLYSVKFKSELGK